MEILILNEKEVKDLLPIENCIHIMANALSTLALGQATQPPRTIMAPEDTSGLLALMPSYMNGQTKALGLKAVCVFPENSAKGLDIHQGIVTLFNTETGEPLAMMNASAITSIRTAAVSAVATKFLARENAGCLFIVGAGIQGKAHVEAIAQVRDLKRICVFDMLPDKVAAFKKTLGEKFSFPIEGVDSVEEGVRKSDIIVTVTTSANPIVHREWVRAGTHINAVGACNPWSREIDTATVKAASFFVDRAAATVEEAGEYVIAAKEGAIGPEHIRGEIGEVIIGKKIGRESNEEITLFKSVGVAIEDVAAAAFVYQMALEQKKGVKIEF